MIKVKTTTDEWITYRYVINENTQIVTIFYPDKMKQFPILTYGMNTTDGVFILINNDND